MLVNVIGFFMGFGFGVGCALAVMYSIYTGGYRKAMEDSLREEESERYLQLLPKIQESWRENTPFRKARRVNEL
jgi:hypothetical protein